MNTTPDSNSELVNQLVAVLVEHVTNAVAARIVPAVTKDNGDLAALTQRIEDLEAKVSRMANEQDARYRMLTQRIDALEANIDRKVTIAVDDAFCDLDVDRKVEDAVSDLNRSEEHTSELQSH